MAGYLVLGMGFGILMQDKGYGWWWAALMSLSIYAGSMQYVAVDLIAGGASLITAALMTIMVNIRHLFYGITMLNRYKNTGKAKPYLIYSLTDETFSLVCSPDLPKSVDQKRYYLYVSALDQCYWVIGSILGGLIGSALPFDTTGVDFAMTALFAIIWLEQWEKSENHLASVTGLIISILCLLIFGADQFLIPSMLIITAALIVEKRWLEEEVEDE
jgi:4-azaleucine resistance transporter AzlC